MAFGEVEEDNDGKGGGWLPDRAGGEGSVPAELKGDRELLWRRRGVGRVGMTDVEGEGGMLEGRGYVALHKSSWYAT